MSVLQAVRGMNDILPNATHLWQQVEKEMQRIFSLYGYQEIRLPLLEKTALFKRSIGEATDIVEKEMYTFQDRNNESLTLRPEGTAGCVRAAIEHGLLHNQQQKLWYHGPMFRYERPQKGRYRQFYQAAVETFGFSGYVIEAELLLMTARLWQALGFAEEVSLHLNSLGTPQSRHIYREHFVAYCRAHIAELDEDSKRRLETNPLRILDSKNPALEALLCEAPKLTDYLDASTQQSFSALCDLLKETGLSFTVSNHLVRGLDYYTGTVFEWITDSLGAQGTICGGGRYDGLVSMLGGDSTPAVGFAMGLDRIVALLAHHDIVPDISACDVYLIMAGEEAEKAGLLLAEKLHNVFPTLRIGGNYVNSSFKSQFKRANKSGAFFALILGEDELRRGMITCKNLRKDSPQLTLTFNALVDHLRSAL